MRLLRLLPLAVCLALTGCPSYSVHPLYTDQDAVVEPALEGWWSNPESDDKQGIVFQKSSDRKYTMSVLQPDAKVRQNYEVHLVRLGSEEFMDIIADDQTINGVNLDLPMGAIPTHVILKVKISGDDLAFATLEGDAIRKQSPAGEVVLDYQMLDRGVLVTAPTDALRRYLAAHTQDVFTPVEHLKRTLKSPTHP